MNRITLKKKLITILGQIQEDSDLECPPLTGATKPIDDLPEFDSMVWPVATTILATEINAEIPNDVNIFVNEETGSSNSIDEIATFVCDVLLKNQNEQQAAAA